MRRGLAIIVAAALLACVGCLKGTPPITVTPPPERMQPLPPVMPERVTEQNYRSMAQALGDEMEREEQRYLFGSKVE